ncbi:MAG: septal ring lytic transglycosylase RlpA family protein [Nevskia sp.]|nr:septal ring lytic transglycosylase RlpA family protein [Nevskia sp.]
MRVWKALLGASALLLTACASQAPRYPVPEPAPVPRSPPLAQKLPPRIPANRTPALPPAPAAEKDRPPAANEIPANVGDIPDAVPESVEKSRYGNPESYEVFGVHYDVLQDAAGFKERGHASWYGKKFHGRRTSSGETYDMFAMSGAHKTLPIPTYARVTNLENGKSVVVRINDRGPFHQGRIVDLSYSAAHRIGIIGGGSGEVELEVVDAAGRTLVASKPSAAAARTAAVAEAKPLPPGPPVTLQVALKIQPRFLQAGSFSDSRNAATFREHLAIAGIRPLLMKSETRDGQWQYRVLVGPFADPAALEAMRRKLADGETRSIPVSE